MNRKKQRAFFFSLKARPFEDTVCMLAALAYAGLLETSIVWLKLINHNQSITTSWGRLHIARAAYHDPL